MKSFAHPAMAVVLLAMAASAVSITSGAAPGRSPSAAAIPYAELAEIERSLADLQIDEGAAKIELARLPAAIANAHARVVMHGRAFYRMTRVGTLAMGGGFESFVAHAMRAERLRRLLVGDVEAEKKAGGRSEQLAKKLEGIGKEKQALAARRGAIESAQFAIEDDVKRQEAFGRAFEGESQSGRASIGSGGGSIVVYGASEASGSGESDDGVGFRLAKGKLVFPIIGKATPRSAKREGASGPGLEIRAAAGTPVRAVYGGHVAFADRYPPYGRMLIIDHGDHYFSVSGNLATIDVKVGDTVTAGTRIGTIGDDGKGSMLYFEVRHGSETIPPRPWLGI